MSREYGISGISGFLADLESLDATILQFDPDHQVEAIGPPAFRPPKDWSNRGQMTRICLGILCQAAVPLTPPPAPSAPPTAR